MINILLNIILFFFIITPTYAYLGPGIGGGILMASLGVLIAIFAAVFALVWFPIKRFLKKRNEKIESKKKLD